MASYNNNHLTTTRIHFIAQGESCRLSDDVNTGKEAENETMAYKVASSPAYCFQYLYGKSKWSSKLHVYPYSCTVIGEVLYQTVLQ